MSYIYEEVSPELLLPEDRDTRYDNTPMKFVKAMGAKQKGKYYELITDNVLRGRGSVVNKPVNSDHDRIIDGVKSEIKGSCLMKNTDLFTFLQIRPKQDYAQMIFSMFYPDKIIIMSMTKEKVLENVANGTFSPQHGGKNGDSGTYMYYGNENTLGSIGAVEVG